MSKGSHEQRKNSGKQSSRIARAAGHLAGIVRSSHSKESVRPQSVIRKQRDPIVIGEADQAFIDGGATETKTMEAHIKRKQGKDPFDPPRFNTLKRAVMNRQVLGTLAVAAAAAGVVAGLTASNGSGEKHAAKSPASLSTQDVARADKAAAEEAAVNFKIVQQKERQNAAVKTAVNKLGKQAGNEALDAVIDASEHHPDDTPAASPSGISLTFGSARTPATVNAGFEQGTGVGGSSSISIEGFTSSGTSPNGYDHFEAWANLSPKSANDLMALSGRGNLTATDFKKQLNLETTTISEIDLFSPTNPRKAEAIVSGPSSNNGSFEFTELDPLTWSHSDHQTPITSVDQLKVTQHNLEESNQHIREQSDYSPY